MASTAAEISTNNHSGSSRTPRVRVVKGGRYGLSKARQFARTAGTVLVIAIFFGLFASIVASQARITQLSGEIDDAKSELTNAQSYNDYLSTTMDQITNSTSVQQEAEDRLVSNNLLDLRAQPVLKLDTLRKLSICLTVVRIKLSQLRKLCSILNNRHIPLLQLKELNFLLTTNIFRKVLPQKLPTEHSPSDILTCSFQLLTSL